MHLERSCIVVVLLCVVCWLCEVGGCERAAGATAPDAGAGAGHRRLTTSAPERSCLAGFGERGGGLPQAIPQGRLFSELVAVLAFSLSAHLGALCKLVTDDCVALNDFEREK